MDQRFSFIRVFIFLFVLGWPSFSCLGQEKITLQKGITIDTFFCEKHPNHSYAYYLPSNYDESKKWPIVYIFEPLARGWIPVDSFKMAAERYGYILVGSNNSRNGPWQNMIDAISNMVEDASARFSIDTKRVYTSGFSGGSRAASMVAAVSNEIAGVIGCGAALPNRENLQPTKDSDYVYYGLVGDKDMNYQEMYSHDDLLTKWNFATRLRIFPAGHQWPSPDLLLEAVEWMELQAMKKEVRSKDTLFLAQQKKQYIQHIERLKQEENFIDLAKNYQYLLKDFSEEDLSWYTKELEQLIQSEAYQNALKEWKKIQEKELAYQQIFQSEFQKISWNKTITAENRTWWQKESKKLYQLQKSPSPEQSKLASRLLNIIIGASIENSWSNIRNKNYEEALLFASIRTIIQPDEAWAYESLARIQILNGHKKAAIKSLKQAIALGLKKDYIKNKTVFDPLKDFKKFNKLLSD